MYHLRALRGSKIPVESDVDFLAVKSSLCLNPQGTYISMPNFSQISLVIAAWRSNTYTFTHNFRFYNIR